MKVSRYSGAGNTFWITDGELSRIEVVDLCRDGTDGVIFLCPSQVADYAMETINADGSRADMCGNGLRCLARFIEELGDPSPTHTIETPAGILETTLVGDQVKATMPEPKIHDWEVMGGSFLDTGVPHFVRVVDDLETTNLKEEGRRLRHAPAFGPEGANINWIEITGLNSLKMRTYERGVEGETLACGTGATAAALVLAHATGSPNPVEVTTRSGERLLIEPERPTMTGPARCIFTGTLPLKGSRIGPT